MTFQEKQKTLQPRRNNLKKRATPSEQRIHKILIQLGVKFIFQKGFIQGDNYVIVDFYIPRLRLCLEIDGGYHLLPSQVIRDSNRDEYLIRKRKFAVKHITNEVADAITQDELKSFINGPTN